MSDAANKCMSISSFRKGDRVCRALSIKWRRRVLKMEFGTHLSTANPLAIGPIEITWGLIVWICLIGTFWGLVASARAREWKWFVGIIGGWMIGLGWMVGWVYVMRRRRLRPETTGG